MSSSSRQNVPSRRIASAPSDERLDAVERAEGRRDDDDATGREVAHPEGDVVLGRGLEQAHEVHGQLPGDRHRRHADSDVVERRTSRPSSRFVHVT